jgi:hypothetical protein
VYLQDIGTSGYTEYEFDMDFIRLIMKDSALRDLKRGHIHSHNTMNVFFSGTDNSELVDNAPNYNYYLSLIVNNRNEMTARVAFVTTIKSSDKRTYIFKGNEGEDLSLEVGDEVKEEQKVLYYDCDIEIEKDEIEQTMLSRYTEIKEKVKVVPATSKITSYEEAMNKFGSTKSWNSESNFVQGGNACQGSFFQEQEERAKSNRSEKTNYYEEKSRWNQNRERKKESNNSSDFWGSDYWEGEEQPNSRYDKQSTGNVIIDDDTFNSDEDLYEENLEKFVCQYILNDFSGNIVNRFSDVEQVIEHLAENRDKMSKREWIKYCDNLSKGFDKLYSSFWNDVNGENTEAVISDSISILLSNAPIGTQNCVDDLAKSLQEAVV